MSSSTRFNVMSWTKVKISGTVFSKDYRMHFNCRPFPKKVNCNQGPYNPENKKKRIYEFLKDNHSTNLSKTNIITVGIQNQVLRRMPSTYARSHPISRCNRL